MSVTELIIEDAELEARRGKLGIVEAKLFVSADRGFDVAVARRGHGILNRIAKIGRLRQHARNSGSVLLVKSKALWPKAAAVHATRSPAGVATRAAKPIAVRLAPIATETSTPNPKSAAPDRTKCGKAARQPDVSS